MVGRPAVAIRLATDADIPACAALSDRIHRSVFVWDPGVAYGLPAFKRRIDGEVVTIAWVDCRIAGFVSVYRPDNFVHTLYVDLPWHGCGIGRRLLGAGLTGLNGAARLKCSIANLPAQRFYQRLGRREVARSGTGPANWILYICDLPRGRDG